jgi:hypothetical protein
MPCEGGAQAMLVALNEEIIVMPLRHNVAVDVVVSPAPGDIETRRIMQ